MKKVMLLALAALMAVGCSKNDSATISANVEGAAKKDIIVAQLAVSQMRAVDTLKTGDNCMAKGEIAMAGEEPNFYYLVYNGKRLASLILKPGDNVSVKVDTLGKGLVIEGSEESLLLQHYENALAQVNAEFNALSAKFAEAVDKKETALAKDLSAQLGRLYIKHRQATIKKIMENPYAFANVQVLYQSVANQLPVFSAEKDFLLMQRVHDSLATIYPGSVYLKSLQGQIKSGQNATLLADKIAKAGEESFPNISLPDINAKNVDLSSLEGKPFILMFWTITEASQKMFNNDLKELYRKYSDNGLEIYQVSLDVDKTAWATAVKEQELPWISVCDGKGSASPSIATYNIATIPYMFVFNKNGDIVARGNLTNKGEIEAAIKKAVK